MLTLLNNWKLIISISVMVIFITIIGCQHAQITRLKNSNDACVASVQLMQGNLNSLKAMAEQQQKSILMREQEAAFAKAKADQQIKSLYKDAVPKDCEGAIQYGIIKATDMPGWIWDNDIP